ncbi:hypothetical protein H4R19_005310, partial [Coemansia spiralis]
MTESDDQRAGPVPGVGGNRVSLVFQQLHGSAAASPAGPAGIRRSITASVAASAVSPRALQRRCGSDSVHSAQLQPHDSSDSETARLLGPTGDAPGSERRTLREVVRDWAAAGRRVGGWVLPTTDVQRVAVFKAVLAYAAAALFAFVPALRDFLGDPEHMSPHLVTNATIWYHAAKTRSGLAEGGLVGAVWVCVTSAVTYLALFVAEQLHSRFTRDPNGPAAADVDALPLALASKLASLGVFIFGYSWCLALFKANANRPSVATATAIANVVLYLVMLREAPIVNYKAAAAAGIVDGGGGRLPWPGGEDGLAESVGKKAEHVLVAVLAGIAISLAVGWTVRPTTAAAALRKELGAVLDSFREILPQLLAPIVDSGAVPATPGARPLRGAKPEELKSALRTHRQKVQQLRQQLEAAALEPTEWHVWARRRRLAVLVACLDGLSLHLGGLSVALELHAGGNGSDTGSDRLDAAAYAAVVESVRAPVVRLGCACDKALAAVR